LGGDVWCGWLGAVSEGAREIPTSKAIENSFAEYFATVHNAYISAAFFREI